MAIRFGIKLCNQQYVPCFRCAPYCVPINKQMVIFMCRTSDHCITGEMILFLQVVTEKSGKWVLEIDLFAQVQDCPQRIVNKIQAQL